MSCTCNKRLLLTGATGLLGRVAAEPLLNAGYEVYALTIDKVNPDNGFTWINCNIFDSDGVSRAFKELRPSHLMHFAWITTGDYLTNNLNFDFLRASLCLLENFAACGGVRAVFSGTCFEYGFKQERLKESDEVRPLSVYGKCKNWTREAAELFCANNGISFAWGRIFNLFGSGEAPTRLTGSIIKNISEGRKTLIKSRSIIRDYIYSKDVAAAFAAILDSEVSGAVNVCTGRGVSIEEYARALAGAFGAEDLLEFADIAGNQPEYIVGDNTRLANEVGFVPRYNLHTAAEEIAKLSNVCRG